MQQVDVSGTMLETIRSERISDTIYKMLRERIVDHTLPSGSRINVDEIARQLGVSRTPVHEALSILAIDGLVEVVPRRGTFVATFNSDDLREILDVRRALELLACETAVERVDDRALQSLVDLMKEMSSSLAREEDRIRAARRHDAANFKFHRTLVVLSDNRKLLEVYDGLQAHLQIARTRANVSDWSTRVPIEDQEHGEIVAALRERSVSKLKAAVEAHVRRSSASLLADLQALGSPAPGNSAGQGRL